MARKNVIGLLVMWAGLIASVVASLAIGSGLIDGTLGVSILGLTAPSSLLTFSGWVVIIGTVISAIGFLMNQFK